MSDSLDKYLPEFDEKELRERLAGSSFEDLTDMLIYAYKEKRVIAKMLDIAMKKLERIKSVSEEPLSPAAIPSADELRRMMEDDNDGQA